MNHGSVFFLYHVRYRISMYKHILRFTVFFHDIYFGHFFQAIWILFDYQIHTLSTEDDQTCIALGVEGWRLML